MRKIPRFHRVIEGPPFRVLSNSQSTPGRVYSTSVAVDGSIAHCNCPGFSRDRKTCSHATAALAEWREFQERGALMPELVKVTQEPGTAIVAAGPDMMPLVISGPPRAMIPTKPELVGMMELSKYLSMGAGFMIPSAFDRPSKVFGVVYAGWELGVRPMVALRHMFPIDGKVEMDAQLMMGVVMSRDRSARYQWTMGPGDTGAEVELYRSNRLVSVGRWTDTDAERSGQLKRTKKRKVADWKKVGDRNVPVYARDERGAIIEEEIDGVWQKYPTRMYAWNAVRIASRLGAPDIINAIEGPFLGAGELAAVLPELEQADKDVDEFLEDFSGHADAGPPDISTYGWSSTLTPMLERDRVLPTELDAVVGDGEADDRGERIDGWLFAVDVTDLAARCRELVDHVLERRQPAPPKQRRFDGGPDQP